MKYKTFVSILLCICLVIGLSACTTATTIQDKKQIAVIVKSQDSDFWQSVKKGVDAAATEYNVSVTFEGPENEEDYESQNKMIENAVNRGVDAIIISAIDYDRCSDAVTQAAQSGVKIVSIDSTVHSSAVNMFIGTDNLAAGKMAAKAATEAYQDENIAIGVINCDSATDNGKKREEAFREYIDSVDNAEIVSVANIDSSVEAAEEEVMHMLTNYPKINVLVGLNEFMTLGIGNAIKDLELSQKIYTIGFDSNIKSVDMLETGEIDSLVVQNPFAIGYLGVRYAVDLIEGNATQMTVYTQTSLITKDNMYNEENQKLLFRFN